MLTRVYFSRVSIGVVFAYNFPGCNNLQMFLYEDVSFKTRDIYFVGTP